MTVVEIVFKRFKLPASERSFFKDAAIQEMAHALLDTYPYVLRRLKTELFAESLTPIIVPDVRKPGCLTCGSKTNGFSTVFSESPSGAGLKVLNVLTRYGMSLDQFRHDFNPRNHHCTHPIEVLGWVAKQKIYKGLPGCLL